MIKMKVNVAEVKYSNPVMLCTGSGWWTWTEICDKCGKISRDSGDALANGRPDTKEEDLCIDCLRHLLDEKIRRENNYG